MICESGNSCKMTVVIRRLHSKLTRRSRRQAQPFQPLLLFAILFCFLLPAQGADIKAGSSAPPLVVRSLLQAPQGFRGTWQELRGRAVVLEFWATWCGGCVDNIPHVNDLAERFKSQPLQFISITDETDIDLVTRFLARHAIRGWVAFDSEETTFKAYGIEGRPRMVLVDANGVVQGITDPTSVTPEVLEALLAGKSLSFPGRSEAPPLGLEPDAPPALLQILIRPAAPVAVSGYSPGAGVARDGRYDIYGVTLRRILAQAYDVPENRVDAPDWCSTSRYDFSIVTPQHREDLRSSLLRQGVESTFGLKLHKELIDTPVYVLKKIDGQVPRLQTSAKQGANHWNPRGELEAEGTSIGRLRQIANEVLGQDVLDETKLEGLYSFDLKWNGTEPQSIAKAIQEQLGLELVSQHRKLEHLVIDSIQDAKTW
jgi:uncharacterized protein (TIGR03435 family)